MTTIAYHHKSKTIAADSRQTMHGTIINDQENKILTVDGVTFALSGKVCDTALFIDYYLNKSTPNLLPECSGLVIDNGVAYSATVNDDQNVDKFKLDVDFAIGSGCNFALAAMDFGCSAKEAVKYAMTRDVYSGGKVRVIKVK